MTTILKWIYVLGISFILMGCEEKSDYQYLMKHPMALQREVAQCKAATPKTAQENARCHIVVYAAVNFTSLLTEQQQDPQKFGQRIMDAQYANMQAKDKLVTAQTSFNALKNKNSVDLNVMKVNVDKAQQNYQEKLAEVNVLLAVISLSRPE